MGRVVILMSKLPQPGRVKTRLAAGIGSIGAAWWFRHQMLGTARGLSRVPKWQLVLSVAPDSAVLSPAFPPHIPRMAQGGGDLGARMLRALSMFAQHDVLLVGADIPRLDRSVIECGFDALNGADMVFGPASDRGYWMIGAKPRAIFSQDSLAGVRWSTGHALSDSIARLGKRNRIALGPTLSDVDRAEDLPKKSR